MKKSLFISLIALSGCFTDTTPGRNTNNNSTTTSTTTTETSQGTNNKTNQTTSGTTIACIPSEEICDQKDNDCDGEIDEELVDCCFSDAECTDGKACSPDHKCVSCSQDILCTDADASTCDAGKCVPCQTSDQCAHITGKAFCSSGKCTECEQDSDCSNGKVCDPTQKLCTTCIDDTQCGGEKCLVDAVDASQNSCVSCLDNTECNDAQSSKCADDNTCSGCEADADCSHITGAKFCRNGVCNECEVNADCSNGEKCDPNQLVCSPCLVDTDCNGTTQCLVDAVDAANNACVACLDNSVCTSVAASTCNAANTCEGCGMDSDCAHLSDTTKCKSNVCVECVDDSTCNGKACDTSTNQCSNQNIGSVPQCGLCSGPGACESGFHCVSSDFNGNDAGKVCYKSRMDFRENCDAPYSKITRVTTLAGINVYSYYCGPKEALTSCAPMLRIGSQCSSSGISCGNLLDSNFSPLNMGGVCKNAGVLPGYCTYACDDDAQCPANSTCVGGFCTKP